MYRKNKENKTNRTMNLVKKIVCFSSFFTCIFYMESALASCMRGVYKTVDMPAIRAKAPGTSSSTRLYTSSGTHLQEEGWAIVKFNYTHSGNLDYIDYDWTGDGGNYASESEVRESYEKLIDAAGKAGDYAAQGKYREEMESALKIVKNIKSNRGSIRITVGVRAGSGFDFRDKRLVVYPKLTKRCIGTSSQIRRKVSQGYNQIKNRNISNQSPQPIQYPQQTQYAKHPQGNFSDKEWIVSLNCNDQNCFYSARNKKTGVSLNLNNSTLRKSYETNIYTWRNGRHKYQVRWKPKYPSSISVNVFNPRGAIIRSLFLSK